MNMLALQNIDGRKGLDDLLQQQQTIPLAKPLGPEEIGISPGTSEDFGDLLKGMIEEVNLLQRQAGDKEKQFLKGEISDVHEVMIASEEASVAFSLLMEIRNKLLDAYREILRMQA